MVYRSEIFELNNKAILRHKPLLDDRLFSKLESDVSGWGCIDKCITREQLQNLINRINADRSRDMKYIISGIGGGGYNCLTWCFEKLDAIGIDARRNESCFDRIILSPKRHTSFPGRSNKEAGGFSELYSDVVELSGISKAT